MSRTWEITSAQPKIGNARGRIFGELCQVYWGTKGVAVERS